MLAVNRGSVAGFLILALLLILTPALARDPGSMFGGGNFTNGRTDYDLQYAALRAFGGSVIRMNLYPFWYYRNGSPSPEVVDDAVLQAYSYGVTPLLLFEYYGSYAEAGELLGGYEKWYDIGRAFAVRFGPNSEWLLSNGVENWGISVYAAMNEPDGERSIPKDEYRAALEGLADGVHSVDSSLRVIPGGFMAANARRDYTLAGYGLAIADLLNEGKLHGIDLHTYYDVQYAPMSSTYDFSAQSNFDSVKRACGITRDISFYTTEFNFKQRVISEEAAARGLLTGIWDNLGVVKNDGSTPATQYALAWNLFRENYEQFGLIETLDPLVLNARGRVLQTVLQLTEGMAFEYLDPRGGGEYLLSGNGKLMWVWQNRVAWSSKRTRSYTVTGIPEGVTEIEVYNYEGLMRVVTTDGDESYRISDLPLEQTYMFLMRLCGTGEETGS